MSPGIFNGGVSVDIGQEAQTEPVRVVGGVRESVDNYAGLGCVEGLPYPIVEFVVNY